MRNSKVLRAAVLSVITSIGTFTTKADDTIKVITTLPTTGTSKLYIGNKDPLAPSPVMKLPIGSIQPKGWLQHQLKLEADGMAGHLQEISGWCKFDGNAWTDPNRKGKNGWEEVPYWIRGYGDLGYVLKDQRIINDTKRWLDAIFAAQAPDGWIGPDASRTSLKGKPDMWPAMPILNTMQSYYEYTGDQRVIDLMTKYFKWQLNCPETDFFTGYWDKMRTGDNMESVYWLYNRTGDPDLLKLAEKIHKHAADWVHHLPNWHNVNIAEGFREPAEFFMQAKDVSLIEDTERDYHEVKDKYGQVPGGGFGGDENCRPGHYDPRQGFETCGMVEFMHSFEMLEKITGNPIWADRNEEVAFNSFPASMTADLKALHYLTSPNQVQLDQHNKAPAIQNRGTMFSYSPQGVYRCCQHNHSMGWPYYAEELWLATGDGGLLSSLYAASDVTAKVGDGTEVKIAETTDYPFNDTINLKVSTTRGVQFPLYLRVPGWCDKPTFAVNGKDTAAEGKAGSFIVIDRVWADGDTVTLKLPMKVEVKTWEKNNNSASVMYGPLAFSLQIGQRVEKYGGSDQWPETNVFPTTAWNYGLVLDGANLASNIQVQKQDGAVADQPFTPETSPIKMTAKAKKIPGWGVDKNNLIQPLQASPVSSDQPEETVTLIPMGAARLRISSFPVIGTSETAKPWTGAAGTMKATASHTNESDSIEALSDNVLPSASSDEGIPRFTWWDHRGSAEWVQYNFDKAKKITSSEVYWFDDTGHGNCRVPSSWKLQYKDGDNWKPVEGASSYEVKKDAMNHVTFNPVETTAIRLEANLAENYSGGILEWKVN